MGYILSKLLVSKIKLLLGLTFWWADTDEKGVFNKQLAFLKNKLILMLKSSQTSINCLPQKTKNTVNIYQINKPPKQLLIILFVCHYYNIIQSRMLNYKKTIQTSQKYIEDLPTATKTYQNDNSLSRLGLSTPKKKVPLKNDQRVQQAKSQINSIINQMSSKKSMNMEGLEVVRGVNADALAAYKPGQQFQQLYRNNADYGDYNPQYQAGINVNPNFNEGYDPNQSPALKSYNGMSLQEENLELTRALNDQIRQNNYLLKRINHLETENDHLRGRLGFPSPRKNLRSTYYSSNPNLSYPSINNNNQNTNNSYHQGYESQQQNSPYFNTYNGTPEAMSSEYDRTAKFGQPHSSWNTTHQMNSPKSSYNAFDGRQRNLSPVDLLKQLQEIKDYDEALRQKTIQLLKKGN